MKKDIIKKASILIICLLGCLNDQLIGQTDLLYSAPAVVQAAPTVPSITPSLNTFEMNLEKYWHYRKRLKEQFMWYIAYPDSPESGSNLPAEAIQIEIKKNGEIKKTGYWADGVWWLGHYIAMLSLEYRMLKDNKQDYTETYNELRSAFSKYHSLDWHAEEFWGGAVSYNGFYMRDDVPNEGTFSDFVKEEMGIDIVKSSYSENVNHPDNGNTPSQDQAWSMYLGLLLAKTFVDDPWIQMKVKEVAYLIVKGMQKTDFEIAGISINSWKIINPVNGNLIQGSEIGVLKFAHASAGTKLAEKNMHWALSDGALAISEWLSVQNNLIFTDKGYNWYGIMTLSTVMNDRLIRVNDDWNLYDWLVDMGGKAPMRIGGTSLSEFFLHLPAIACILYGYNGNSKLPASKYEYYLDAAPYCGAYHFDQDNRTSTPWHTLSLLCPWHVNDVGMFNMLDYMLLYNSYFMLYNYDKSKNVYLTITAPCNTNTTQTAAKIIEIQNIIASKVSATYTAGENVLLKPGFHAQPGSFFTAKVDKGLDNRFYYKKVNPIGSCAELPYANASYSRAQKRNDVILGEDSEISFKDKYKDDDPAIIHISPNPTNGNLIVQNAENYDYQLLSVIGEVKMKGRLASANEMLDVSRLFQGVYIMQLYKDDIIQLSTKIIKQ